MAILNPSNNENVIVTRNIQTDTLMVGLPVYKSGQDWVVLHLHPNPFGRAGTDSKSQADNRRAMLQSIHQQVTEELAMLALNDGH